MNETAIACTLDAGSFTERVAWIAKLNAHSLKSLERRGLALTLTYERSATPDVRKMVAAEQECCAFLKFEVTETSTSIRVTITAPEEARDSVELLFEPFTGTASHNASGACGCTDGCGA